VVRVGLAQRRAAMGSHSVSIQRFDKDGQPVAVGSSTLIKPGELVRLLADGSPLAFGRTAFFEVSFSAQVVFTDSAEINANGNAWLDIAAPAGEGLYVLRVRFPDIFFDSHWAATTFQVSERALPPPDKPKSGSFLGSVQGILATVAVVAVAVMVVPRILPPRR